MLAGALHSKKYRLAKKCWYAARVADKEGGVVREGRGLGGVAAKVNAVDCTIIPHCNEKWFEEEDKQ